MKKNKLIILLLVLALLSLSSVSVMAKTVTFSVGYVDPSDPKDDDLELIQGCQVIIKNNGNINMASGKTFDAPEGAIVDITYGSIN